MKKFAFVSVLCMTISIFVLAGVSHKPASAEEAVSVQEVTPFVYVCISHKGPFSEIENIIGQLMMSSKNQKSTRAAR